jgi:hypothetical protein
MRSSRVGKVGIKSSTLVRCTTQNCLTAVNDTDKREVLHRGRYDCDVVQSWSDPQSRLAFSLLPS